MVVTEGELDAMSVYQETGRAAISLPFGSQSLQPDLVKRLERFQVVRILSPFQYVRVVVSEKSLRLSESFAIEI